jgi:hypothetical protein
MSDQFANEEQQSLTPEEVRQALLAELDASQQAIAELSNEQLEEAVGGGRGWDIVRTKLSCLTCGMIPGPNFGDRAQKTFKKWDEYYRAQQEQRVMTQSPNLSPAVKNAMADWAGNYGATPRRS